MTLWEHEGDRTHRRAVSARSDTEKVRFQRRIAEIVGASKPSKVDLRDAVRRTHAAEAGKPYEAMLPPAPAAPAERPVREKRRLPVEDW
jgi:putative transposase